MKFRTVVLHLVAALLGHGRLANKTSRSIHHRLPAVGFTSSTRLRFASQSGIALPRNSKNALNRFLLRLTIYTTK